MFYFKEHITIVAVVFVKTNFLFFRNIEADRRKRKFRNQSGGGQICVNILLARYPK